MAPPTEERYFASQRCDRALQRRAVVVQYDYFEYSVDMSGLSGFQEGYNLKSRSGIWGQGWRSDMSRQDKLKGSPMLFWSSKQVTEVDTLHSCIASTKLVSCTSLCYPDLQQGLSKLSGGQSQVADSS